MDYFLNKVAEILAPVLELDSEKIRENLKIPQIAEQGDIAFPCFDYAKKAKKDPSSMATELAKKFKGEETFEKVAAQNGYLNFYIKKNLLAEHILGAIYSQKTGWGNSNEGSNKTIVIDFSSPNIAKPFGIGHLRSTNIGRALSNIYTSIGYKVVKINHLGDWGTQFGKLITAYKRWGNAEILKTNPIMSLYKLYVKFHEEEKNEPSINDEAREWFSKLEKGDPEARELWEWFRELSLIEIKKIYSKFGIEFDHYTGESFYNDKIGGTIQRLEEKNLIKKSHDAWIVDLENEGLGVAVLKKKDDSSLYITRDICAAEYRHEHYKFFKALYIVGIPQTLHFKQLFKILELMGYEWYKNCEHIPFGHISFGEKGKEMSTREGTIVFLDDVYDRAVALARNIIEQKNPKLEDKDKVAEKVGVAAIIFADLSSKRVKNVKFIWEEILNFEGETGPYLQYTLVRIKSLARKFSGVLPDEIDFSILKEDEEVALIKELGIFPMLLNKAALDGEPFSIARYLIDLAKAFNRFYSAHKILDGEEKISHSRMALAICTSYVLDKGFALLGIPAPEKM